MSAAYPFYLGWASSNYLSKGLVLSHSVKILILWALPLNFNLSLNGYLGQFSGVAVLGAAVSPETSNTSTQKLWEDYGHGIRHGTAAALCFQRQIVYILYASIFSVHSHIILSVSYCGQNLNLRLHMRSSSMIQFTLCGIFQLVSFLLH